MHRLVRLLFIMWRLLTCVLMASGLQARDLRTRQTTCPNVCDLSRCSSALESCYFGVVKDRCDCCTVCAAGEREYCGDRGHAVCGQGMTCEYRSSARVRACVCVTPMSQCAAAMGEHIPVSVDWKRRTDGLRWAAYLLSLIFIQRGLCETGEGRKTVCFGVHNNWPTGS